jgi:hypothetical protein
MVAQPRASHGEWHVPDIGVGIEQQQRSGRSQAGLERRIEPHQRSRGHSQLRFDTGEGPRQALAQRIGQ